MPIAIVLDVSLSMSRHVNSEVDDELQRKHLAIHGINVLLDHLNAHSKLEFVSLVSIDILRCKNCVLNLFYHLFSGYIFKLLWSIVQFYKRLWCPPSKISCCRRARQNYFGSSTTWCFCFDLGRMGTKHTLSCKWKRYSSDNHSYNQEFFYLLFRLF